MSSFNFNEYASSLQPIILINDKGIILAANSKAKETFGNKSSFTELVHPIDDLQFYKENKFNHLTFLFHNTVKQWEGKIISLPHEAGIVLKLPEIPENAIPFIPLKEKSKIRILVAEDSDIPYMILNGILKNVFKFNPENLARVKTGEAAIETVLKKHFDFIFMDNQMPPGMDGVEATKILRNKGITTVIISYSSDKDIDNSDHRYHAVLPKPSRDQDIKLILKKYWPGIGMSQDEIGITEEIKKLTISSYESSKS